MGAQWVDGKRGWIYQAGGYRAQGDWGRPVLSMTRPLLEAVVRRRVEMLDNVRLEEGTVVERVDLADGRVAGVVVDGLLRAAISRSTVPVDRHGSRTSSSLRGVSPHRCRR